MNGNKMSDCRFYVNEAEGVVVCVIPDTEDMVIDFIYDNCNHPDLSLYDSIWDIRAKLKMPKSFMGKAVCASEDVWNEETGRIIAFSRAKDKCYKSFFRRANVFVQNVDRRLGDAINLFNDFGMKLEHKQAALQQKIDERVKVEE
mgnify:CR=1 FL=1